MNVNQATADSQTNNNGPAYTARRGRLNLTIWANETEQGTRYSTEITRTWKDDKDQYQTTSRLDERDLLPAARLATLADDWIAAARSTS